MTSIPAPAGMNAIRSVPLKGLGVERTIDEETSEEEDEEEDDDDDGEVLERERDKGVGPP